MGYSHGIKWTKENIESAIKDVMDKAEIDTMPSRALMYNITGNHGLGNAVAKRGGARYWANKLGIAMKECETELGYLYEMRCIDFLVDKFGYSCEKAQTRYPYDILVNNNIKIDVKCGNLYHGETCNFYTFNLEKAKPTCDIFVCYCVDKKDVKKVYVIPSCILSGKTQLSIGEVKSVYDKFINKWDVIKAYDDFYKELLAV